MIYLHIHIHVHNVFVYAICVFVCLYYFFLYKCNSSLTYTPVKSHYPKLNKNQISKNVNQNVNQFLWLSWSSKRPIRQLTQPYGITAMKLAGVT